MLAKTSQHQPVRFMLCANFKWEIYKNSGPPDFGEIHFVIPNEVRSPYDDNSVIDTLVQPPENERQNRKGHKVGGWADQNSKY